jgi:beta-phosphoglucomutase-like phosphatase (HAD superfamily)
MKLNEKLVLVDCDGVLVDWLYSFDTWMREHGYSIVDGVDSYDLDKTYGISKLEMKALVKNFNESAAICCIPPLRDAVKYVRKMHEELGCVFHCITSLSLNQYAAKLRRENIENLFGKTAFEKIVCLDTGADKDDALLPYIDSGCLWVEDKISNAELGTRMGLTSVLMEHSYSEDYTNDEIIKVKNWKEIYEMML